MQLHSVTKSLSRALVLLALVAFSASAFAQQRYVITNGDAYKRAKALVGDKFLALDYSADAKNPTITVKESFDESCVWYCNGKPGYYYQLDAEGDRFYLMRTGQTLHVMPVLMGTQNEVFESATQWYDWTFGVATQELAGDARYYWVILNEAGTAWTLSGDTYGRPGDVINAGFTQPTEEGYYPTSETNGFPSSLGEYTAVYAENTDEHGCKVVSAYHSNTAALERTYANGNPVVAATYTPLQVEFVPGTKNGGMTAVTPASTTILNGGADVPVSISASDFTSTSYTKYILQQNVINGTPSYSCDYMTPWVNTEVVTAYERYAYDGSVTPTAPADGRTAVASPLIGYTWKLDNSLARYLEIVDGTEATSKTLRIKSGAAWSSPVTGHLTITATYKNGDTQTRQVEITLAVAPTAVALSETELDITVGDNATVSYTLTPSGAVATPAVSWAPTDNAPTATLNNNVYTINNTAVPGTYVMTVTAAAGITATATVRVHPAAPTAIAFGSDVVSSITAAAGTTIYYTTDATVNLLNAGTGTAFSGTPAVEPGQTVYAVAEQGGLRSLSVFSARYSGPATATNQDLGDGNVAVVLNDLEDHSWSYYSDPASPIRSLNPADVKITYYGNGTNNMTSTSNADAPANTAFDANATGVKVNINGENENTFVYYKTLERADGATATTVAGAAGRCAYTTIPNPFQVRPTYGTNATTKWRGFYAWRVKSVSGGSIYDASTDGNALAANAIINAETEIYFAPTSEYGMEVELEALWARAYVVDEVTNTGLNASSVERNFVVLSSGSAVNMTPAGGWFSEAFNVPATITGRNPDGSGSGSATVSSTATLNNDMKIENIRFSGNNTLNANGHNLTVGRGVYGGGSPVVRSISSSTNNVSYTIRLETGTYGTFNLTSNDDATFSAKLNARAVFGSDYDRAKGNNDSLSIAPNSYVYGSNSVKTFSSNSNRNNLTYDWNMKSGKLQASSGISNDDNLFYMGNRGNNGAHNSYMGKRRLIVEGGVLQNVSGGLGSYGNNYAQTTTYSVNDGSPTVEIIMKGGTIEGSVYGAAVFAAAEGDRRFIFTGGTVNGWIAGGCNGTRTDGGQLYGDTYIYFGGNAKCLNKTSDPTIGSSKGGNIFGAGSGIAGGTTVGQVFNSTVVVADESEVARNVYGGGNYGYVSQGTGHKTDIYVLGGTVSGAVFGGSNQQQGQTVNITMKGGKVLAGVFGGSNTQGTINNNVTINVLGGQVGTSESVTANVHGGGFGGETIVTGNVDVTIGAENATDGPTIYGDVYGGSAMGTVNGTAYDNDKHTYVTVHAGTIKANNGTTNTTRIAGDGSTNGQTFTSTGSVYGGGLGFGEASEGPATYQVYISWSRANNGNFNARCTYSYVNADGTTVNSGDLTSNGYTTVTVKAGSTITLTATRTGGQGTYTITARYNNASGDQILSVNHNTQTGSATVNGSSSTTSGEANVYAGATKVTVTGGTMNNTFGANNVNGMPFGTIATEISGGTIGNVYGGGNAAPYGAQDNNAVPTVLMTGGHVLQNVYGGGLGRAAQITNSRGTDVKVQAGTVDGNVYGGGAKADVSGSTNVVIGK